MKFMILINFINILAIKLTKFQITNLIEIWRFRNIYYGNSCWKFNGKDCYQKLNNKKREKKWIIRSEKYLTNGTINQTKDNCECNKW